MSILERIVHSVEEDLVGRKRRLPTERLRAAAEGAPARAAFRAALECPGTSVIAECKQRSPSKADGFRDGPYDPVAIARTYEAAGARALSVLTEPEFFGGDPDHLRAVHGATRLPLLRKDFLVDPYQCWEARAWGASAALLIVAALDGPRLRDLFALLGELGLDALVEVHSEEEAERALELPAVLLGVNNRDLRTFVTDRDTTARVARLVPDGTTLVSESGISTRAHVEEVERAGAAAVLVGEGLLAAPDPAAKLRELRGEAA